MPKPAWSDCGGVVREEYNALKDPNMRHYFQNQKVQSHLYKTGQIDRAGRIIDLDKNKSKLHIIEQEFRTAEKLAFTRKKDEDDMRHRVQRKRHEALDRSRRQERLMKIKEDKKISQDIVRAARGFALQQPSQSSVSTCTNTFEYRSAW